jgi:thiol-disulfide isomerase/thioredoxin
MRLRKTILLSVPALLLLAAVLLGFKIWNTLKKKEKINTALQQLPSLQLRKLNGTVLFTDSFINTDELLVLNYFNPDCDHCQNMVQELFREQAILQNTNWLMITSANIEKTKRFTDSMNLSKLSNIMVLIDTASLFVKAFGTVSVPSFYVYKNGRLLRKHNGECSISYLLQ